MNRKNFLLLVSIVAFSSIALDQISKFIVNMTVKFGNTKEIISDFFSITNARNYGAAWSIFWEKRIYLILIALAALAFVIFLLYREKTNTKYKAIYYGLLIGGIVGNLIDRVFLGYVIDFLDFKFFGYNYPIFNFSDVVIVISVLLICVECFFPKSMFEEKKTDEVEVLDFDE